MALIFPGIDPYLENSTLWHSFHTQLIVAMGNLLQPLLLPRYVATVEERIVVEGRERQERIADVGITKRRKRKGSLAVMEASLPITLTLPALEIRERYLHIIDLEHRRKVIAVLEVLSPTNKWAGPGRETYLKKQTEIRHSDSHLIEVDLLRAGEHLLAVPEWAAREEADYDYLACVNPGTGVREVFQLYPWKLRQPCPRISIPLARNDPAVVLDLQAALENSYNDGAFAYKISYRKPCKPRLSREDQHWADQLIRKAFPHGSPSSGSSS